MKPHRLAAGDHSHPVCSRSFQSRRREQLQVGIRDATWPCDVFIVGGGTNWLSMNVVRSVSHWFLERNFPRVASSAGSHAPTCLFTRLGFTYFQLHSRR